MIRAVSVEPLVEPIAHIAPVGTIGVDPLPMAGLTAVERIADELPALVDPLVHRLQREPSRHQEDADTTCGEREWYRNHRTRSGPIRQGRRKRQLPFVCAIVRFPLD